MPRVDRVARVERTRPVVAGAASAVKIAAIVTVARSGQEETVAVGGGEETSVHAVLGRPRMGRVLVKLLPFLLGGHAPAIAPIVRGRIVLGQQGGQVVGETIIAVAGIVAVLSEQGHEFWPITMTIIVDTAIAILVGIPVVCTLWAGLTPSEVVAIVLRVDGTHVTGGPQQATRQAQVDIDVFIICRGETELIAIYSNKAVGGVGTHIIGSAHNQPCNVTGERACSTAIGRVSVSQSRVR